MYGVPGLWHVGNSLCHPSSAKPCHPSQSPENRVHTRFIPTITSSYAGYPQLHGPFRALYSPHGRGCTHALCAARMMHASTLCSSYCSPTPTPLAVTMDGGRQHSPIPIHLPSSNQQTLHPALQYTCNILNYRITRSTFVRQVSPERVYR